MPDPSSYPNAGRLHRERMAFERDFTQLPNAWLRDKRLTFKARGLLALLMTHDAGYEVSLSGITAASWGDGKDAVRTGVTELERAGYLHRVRERRRGKFGGYLWVLQDPFEVKIEPTQLDLFPVDSQGGKSNDGKSNDGGLTASENPTTIEDQVKNISSTSVTHEPTIASVENLVWSDDRCGGNWRDSSHEISGHGMCRHCHERPLYRSAS